MKTTLLAVFVVGTIALVGCKKEEEAAKKVDEAAKKVATKIAAKAEAAKKRVEDKTAATTAEKDAHADFAQLTVAQLDTMIAAKEIAVFDANGKTTREKHGKIPTAALLSHYADYKASELPADKSSKVVFYCSNTQCQAAPAAAKKAVASGYTDVNVLPVGVMGWKDAGKTTEKI